MRNVSLLPVLLLLSTSACSGATVRQRQYYARETLSVRIAPAQLQTFAQSVTRIGSDDRNSLASVGIDAYSSAANAASGHGEKAYEAALADARRKAELLAQHSGARLGPVAEIDEISGDVPLPQMPIGRPMVKHSAVSTSVMSATTPVSIMVVYHLASSPGGAITVVGRALAEIATADRLVPDRLSVSINASGATPEAALDALHGYDQRVRATSHSFGIAPADVQIRDLAVT
jgi:uncharacterized protein YggE